MEPGFIWAISPATLLAMLGWAATGIIALWKRSGAESTYIARLNAAHEGLEALAKKHDGLVEEIDQRASALQAAGSLMREQHHELREYLAREFMPRNEIASMERRLTDAHSSVNGRIDKLENRLDTMQSKILEAIAKTQLRA